ncbi:MAG: hypothetical protein DSY60_03595 [Persephonella sp.]|nr:MAG: hypothetical protein DSY60_03595 [Persephonella sp.]
MAEKDKPQKIIYQSWIYYWVYIFLLILIPFTSINVIIFATAVYHLSFEISLLIFIVSIIFSIIIYVYMWINRSSHKIYIYGEKIVYEIGFLNKKYKEIKKKDIRAVEVDQPLIHRILNIGTLKFATAGTTGYEIIFEGVKSPHKVKKDIEKSAKELKKLEEKKKKEKEKKKLEVEKVRKRKLKKTLRFVKKVNKKPKEEDDEEKTQVKIFLKVYK